MSVVERQFTLMPLQAAATALYSALVAPYRSVAAFSVAGARDVTARITGDAGEARVWRFAHPAGRVAFAWTPTRPGSYRLTVSARSRSGSAR